AATETESLWAKWAPGAVQIEDRGSYQPGGYSHSEQLHGSSAFAVAPRSDKATGPRVRLCKELAESWSTRDILRVTDCHLEEFDVVHSVVALHRIAKSNDRGELHQDPALVTSLSRLAASAASSAGEMTLTQASGGAKEVSKAFWALAKIGPW
ncbi:unnamed protein product, partial [Polarella glacialis]